MITTILFPFLLNQYLLISENDPLKYCSVNSKFAVESITKRHLLKNDIMKSMYLVTLFYFVKLANPYLYIVSIIIILKQ